MFREFINFAPEKFYIMDMKHYSSKGLIVRILLLFVWVGFLIFLVDGLRLFGVLSGILGYGVTEILLWVLVLVPAVFVALYGWRYFSLKRSK